MATTINFESRVGGVLTNAVSAVLESSDSTYGIRNGNTLALVVAAGTALTNSSTGVYTYSISNPVASVPYEYWIKVSYNGTDYHYYHDVIYGEDIYGAATATAGGIQFTSQEEIERLYSTIGVNVRMDDLSAGDQESLWIDLVNAATETVASYTLRFYDSETIEDNAWVRRRATIIAAYYLSMRRANGTQFGLEYQRIMEELEKFLTSRPPIIPGAAIASSSLPTVSRQIVDDRNRYNKLRVDPNLSNTKNYNGKRIYPQPFGPDYF